MIKTIHYSNKTVPVYLPNEQERLLNQLSEKLDSMAMNFEFRKKWKRVMSVQIVRDVAIFQYMDGTKLYLDVS